MNKEKQTPQELLDQAMSLSNKIDNGIADLIKETSKLSDEEKSKLLKDGGFKGLSKSMKKLGTELDKLEDLTNKSKEDGK
jgi:hypothetical protein